MDGLGTVDDGGGRVTIVGLDGWMDGWTRDHSMCDGEMRRRMTSDQC